MGFDARPFLHIVLEKFVRLIRLREMLVKKAPFALFSDARKHGCNSRLYVADKPKIHRRTVADMFRVLIDLNFLHTVALFAEKIRMIRHSSVGSDTTTLPGNRE